MTNAACMSLNCGRNWKKITQAQKEHATPAEKGPSQQQVRTQTLHDVVLSGDHQGMEDSWVYIQYVPEVMTVCDVTIMGSPDSGFIL